ncbi:unnamed protein product [Didymodactylos carnosus]|uniref:Uncharacterized protein n=1 Tax=Didymodactylos carnosus TaxID=1234261 RepID=A0A8S2EWQ9_9BILA|nr:unnamed protein product [Didymodactylos carnosus]CAF4085671.1 unnamed protein product [Didymodactylos carnosus]
MRYCVTCKETTLQSCLLHTIVNWTSQFEMSMPTKLEMNMQCLRELLANNIVIKPVLPVETILKVIQSDDIPAEVWLDCLRAAVQSESNNNNQNSISFDFAPVIMPTMDFHLQPSTLSKSDSSAHRFQSK